MGVLSFMTMRPDSFPPYPPLTPLFIFLSFSSSLTLALLPVRSKYPSSPWPWEHCTAFCSLCWVCWANWLQHSDTARLVLVPMKTKMFGVDKALRQLRFYVKNTRAAMFGQPAVTTSSVFGFSVCLACINIYTGALETGFEMKVPF